MLNFRRAMLSKRQFYTELQRYLNFQIVKRIGRVPGDLFAHETRVNQLELPGPAGNTPIRGNRNEIITVEIGPPFGFSKRQIEWRRKKKPMFGAAEVRHGKCGLTSPPYCNACGYVSPSSVVRNYAPSLSSSPGRRSKPSSGRCQHGQQPAQCLLHLIGKWWL